MNIKIYSDSKYAIGCMTVEAHKWQRNGYRTSADYEVKKEDNILRVNSFYEMMNRVGNLEYFWIPRVENFHA